MDPGHSSGQVAHLRSILLSVLPVESVPFQSHPSVRSARAGELSLLNLEANGTAVRQANAHVNAAPFLLRSVRY
jgi:hypothetical protein